MRTYAKIKELKGLENIRLDEVLKYIAENYDDDHKYISAKNKIQYRLMYHSFLDCEFGRTANDPIFQNRTVRISHRQYKRMRKYVGGRFTVNTAVFLLALYNILFKIYQRKLEKIKLDPHINDITYTKYIMDLLLGYIEIVLNALNDAKAYMDQEDYDICEIVYRECGEVDNIVCNGLIKIYNNVW